MTCDEFSNEFDEALNSYRKLDKLSEGQSIDTIDLDEYEKSVFLTNAQEQLIREFYSGKNQTGDGFEKTEETRRYLSSLVRSIRIPIGDAVSADSPKISASSKLFALPKDVLFIVYETVTPIVGGVDGTPVIVRPESHDDYYSISRNPFKMASSRRSIRIDGYNGTVEIVVPFDISGYNVRYVSRPSPIILTSLVGTGTSIDGISTKTECGLNPVLHRDILGRAVLIAARRYGLMEKSR